MQFSNTTTEDGAIQEIDRICGSNDTKYSLKAKTARLNMALSNFDAIAMLYDKSWSYDDANKYDHDPSPFALPFPADTVLRNLQIAVSNLNANQQDYPFAQEFLGVKAVFVADRQGVFHKLVEETDPQNTLLQPLDAGGNIINSQIQHGIPTKYRFIGNSLLLDLVPDYSIVKGIKLLVNRQSSRFTDQDTTKELGIPRLFHEWACWKASLPYLIKNRLPNKNDIAALIREKEDPTKPGSIPRFFTGRNQTKRARMTVRQESDR